MANFVSKIVGEEVTANGSKRKVTKQFLCDDKGNILHDKPREDDPEGVNRRIAVEAFKAAMRAGEVIKKEDVDGKLKFDKLFWEEFAGSYEQAKEEMAVEVKDKEEIEKEYRDKLKKISTKK